MLLVKISCVFLFFKNLAAVFYTLLYYCMTLINRIFQNMFLAIINDTYSEVKAEIALQRNDFEIADYFKRGYNNMLGKMGKRDKLLDVENTLKLSDANADGTLTFEEIRTNLKK